MNWRIRIDEGPGQPTYRFAPAGPVEVWVRMDELHHQGGWKPRLVMPFQFPSYHRAEVGAEDILRPALAALEAEANAFSIEKAESAVAFAVTINMRTLAAVAAVAAALKPLLEEPLPTRFDGHRHELRFERFSRALPWRVACKFCMTTWEDLRYLGEPLPNFAPRDPKLIRRLEEFVNAGLEP